MHKLPSHISQNSILVSFDVESLYSNIPHDLGLEAITFWTNKYPDEFPKRISSEFVLEGINLILENNFFTSMTSISCKQKALLAYSEEKLYELSEKEFDSDFRSYLEEHFKRFLDDCFLIFDKSEEQLRKFHSLLNSLHPSIKYTIDKSKTHLPFLDTLVISKNGHLYTDIYYKPTDSKQYLIYTSCHPKYTRNSIPYNLARRLRMIITEENTLLTRLEEL